MKVSILIVSWNVKSHVVECIRSIERYRPAASFEVILVDNASEDGTVSCIREEFPWVRIIANNNNLGFGRANNQGARIAQGEYLFALNPDSLLQQGSIDQLLGFMEKNPDISMCGPQVLNEDRSIQRSVRTFQSWQAAFARYTIVKLTGVFKKNLEAWRCRTFDYNRQADVDQLIGAALFVRRDVYERMGGFDEQFFMYYEEVDLCYRIRQGGGRNVFFPGAQVIHVGGRSSSQIPARKQFMILESLIKYLRKHSTRPQSAFLAAFFKAGILAQQLFDLFFGALLFLLATAIWHQRGRQKYKKRALESMNFLAKYYWRLLAV